MDALIIGGGIIGLSTAWRIAADGASVVVLDRAFPPSPYPDGQATQAAAGILSPLTGTSENSTLLQLGLLSLKRFPSFADEISRAAGLAIAPGGPGLLRLDPLETGFFDAAKRGSAGLPLHAVSADQVGRLEPCLKTVGCGLLSPSELSICPRTLHQALIAACRSRGVRLVEVSGLEWETGDHRVSGAATSGGAYRAGQVVIAAGVWSREVASQLGISLALRPVRGQVLLVSTDAVLKHSIASPNGFLVPRDGSILVGSTETDGSCDTTPSRQETLQLLEFARSMITSEKLEVTREYVGLRPASPDGLPILGKLSPYENLHVAAGHFRKGILLAPLTADWMCEQVLHGRSAPLSELLRPDRFPAASMAGEVES